MYSEFQSQIQSLSNGASERNKLEPEHTISAKTKVYPVEHEQDSLYQQYSQENQFKHYNIESREQELKQQHGQDEGNFSFDEIDNDPEIVESYE